jgi:hypothetical protein
MPKFFTSKGPKVRFTAAEPAAPQSWTRKHLRVKVPYSLRGQRKLILTKLKEAMNATGLSKHVRFWSLIGTSRLELYIARDALPAVDAIVNECPDLVYVDYSPSAEAADSTARDFVRQATIQRLGHLLSHAPFALLRECILDGYDSDIQDAALAFCQTLNDSRATKTQAAVPVNRMTIPSNSPTNVTAILSPTTMNATPSTHES